MAKKKARQLTEFGEVSFRWLKSNPLTETQVDRETVVLTDVAKLTIFSTTAQASLYSEGQRLLTPEEKGFLSFLNAQLHKTSSEQCRVCTCAARHVSIFIRNVSITKVSLGIGATAPSGCTQVRGDFEDLENGDEGDSQVEADGATKCRQKREH